MEEEEELNGSVSMLAGIQDKSFHGFDHEPEGEAPASKKRVPSQQMKPHESTPQRITPPEKNPPQGRQSEEKKEEELKKKDETFRMLTGRGTCLLIINI